MEFLKEIFGDGSLTYDELAAKLKDNKDIKLANLAGGMYVDKRKLTDKESELAAANQKINGLEKAVKEFDGVDVKALNAQIKTLQDKYDTDVAGLKLNSALDMALVNAKAHDVKAVKPFLDMSLIKMDGEFKIKAVAGEQGVPAWRDDDHEVLDNFIWFYPVEMWEGKTKRTVVKAQFWTADGVSYWVKDGEYSQTFILDSEMYLEEDLLVGEDNLQQHFMLGSEAGSWGAVPFIAFKNNEYEMSDLQRVKSLIDNYDFSRSDVANTLEEIKSVVYGLRGYGGTDLSEFMRDLAYYRAVKLDSDGGLETYNPSIDINAAKEHYDALKKDIFTFGQGVDKDSDRLGSSPSGVALKFMYSGLDLKCNKLESCFNDGFDNLLYFINRYFEVTGQGGETADIDLIFNRDIAINESQAITDCRNSAGIISDETIIANHPWTKDVKEEMQRLEEQKQTAEEDYSGFGGIEENKEETEEE